MREEFISVYQSLRDILQPYVDHFEVKTDSEESLYLDCPHDPYEKGRPHFFSSVNIKKNYVSFYLMPVYTHPQLLEGISPELNKRRQGKSCFNFKKKDENLFRELQSLLKRSYKTYQEVGYV